MTYDELLDKFRSTFPSAKIADYRPVEFLFQICKVGVTIWLENGDMVVYYPKEEGELPEEEGDSQKMEWECEA